MYRNSIATLNYGCGLKFERALAGHSSGSLTIPKCKIGTKSWPGQSELTLRIITHSQKGHPRGTSLCTGNGTSTLDLMPMWRVSWSPKQRVSVTPQNDRLSPQKCFKKFKRGFITCDKVGVYTIQPMCLFKPVPWWLLTFFTQDYATHLGNINPGYPISVADPGFPVGGRRPRGGRQLPRWLRFKKFVCQNKRIWTRVGGGARAGGAPLGSATEYCNWNGGVKSKSIISGGEQFSLLSVY